MNHPIPQRRLPDGGPSVSLLGFLVDGGSGTRGAPGVVERLKKARSAGVTTFDLGSARNPERSQWLLAEAFPHPDPELTVIQGSGRGVSPSGPATPSETLPKHRTESSWSVIRELSETDYRSEAGKKILDEGQTFGAPGRVSIRVDSDAETLPAAGRVNLFSGPFSLLDSRLGALVTASTRDRTLGFFARDPFASGRLDGSRFSGNWLEGGPSVGPPSLRSLAADFEPVLRLGFLTANRTRTMAQAALQYAARPPWVASVLAPLPPADRMDEILSAFDRPALTEEDLARIERGAAIGRGPSVARDLRTSNRANP